MGIMSWAGLWFGLSIPVIVMLYLFKRKYIDTVVPSHFLWNRVLRNIEANRPWQKLQNRLLLWLQLLVAALLVFALMGPYVFIQGGSKHTVIVVDNSASMDAAWIENGDAGDHPVNRLDQVKEQMRSMIDKMDRGSEITLLELGSQPKVVVSRENDRKAWNKAIDGLHVEFGQASYRESLSLAAALTKDDPDASVVIYSDEQWYERSDDIHFDVPVQVVSTHQEKAANLAIEQFGVKSGPADGSQGGAVSGIAVVRNYSNAAIESTLDLYGDGQLLASKGISMASGQSATVSFEGLAQADVYRLEFGTKDDYAADNMAFAFLEHGGPPSILLLSSGNLFLEKALQLTGSEVIRMDTRDSDDSMDHDEIPILPKTKPDLIVVDGKLPSYFAQGAWADLKQRTPLWTLGGGGQEIELTGGDIKTSVHPVTRYLSIKDSPVASLIDEKIPSWGSPIMTIDGIPAMYAGVEEGSPRLSFLFELTAGDLPLRPEFPIIVNNAVEWLSSGKAAGLGRMNAGAQVEIPVDAEAVEGAWIPVDGYGLEKGASRVAAEKNGEQISSKQKVPGLPGLWRFELKGTEKNVLSEYYLEVSANRLESNIIGEKTLQIPGAGADTENTVKTPYSFVYWIALLALIVILAEWGVYQRGRSI
ncbi:hypothetical protein D3C76_594240 [compost metagenome]